MKCINEGCENEGKYTEYFSKSKDKVVSFTNKECACCMNLTQKYGIKTPERDKLIKQQDFKCASCGSHIEFTKSQGPSKHSAVVDHCHSSGKVRGILCGSCNLLIGNAHESIHNLESAIEYLKKYQ